MISIASHDAFATSPSPPPGFTQIEISELPVLGQEFDLIISPTPDNYDENWTQASDEKTWSTEFTIILPKGFEIVDDDFSDGRPYYGMRGQISDDYRFFSVVRDVGFPPQTTVTIKPTEPGIWQIIATSGAFIDGKIFVTLTESYSYVSDKPNNVVQRDACGKDLDGRYDRIAMFDVESNSIIRNVKNDFMVEESHNDWKIITNPATDLVYVYEHYTTIVPTIYGNSGETKENLALYGPRSSVRISDIAINPETNLIYMADNGRVSGKDHGRILVLDGESHSIISTIEYYDKSGEGEYVRSTAVNPKTNTLYALTGEDNLYVIDLDTEDVITKLHLGEYGYSGTQDIEVNSATNKIYVLNGALYVVDGHTNSAEAEIPVDNWADKIQINENDNEVYLLSRFAGTLLIIDGIDYQTDTINLHRPGFDMDFDHVRGKLYVPNGGGSVTVIDTIVAIKSSCKIIRLFC